MTITMKEISQRIGVSRTAVSAVLNQKKLPQVSPETRRAILELAAAHDYMPNRAAQSLHGKPVKTVALLYYRNYSLLVDEILRRIAEKLYTSGYQSYYVGLNHADEEPGAIRDLRSRGIDGVVSVCYETRLEHAAMPLPLVTVAGIPGECEVAVDLAVGGRLAGEHLQEHGHRKMLFVASGIYYNQAKYDGFRSVASTEPLAVTLYHNATAPEEILRAIDKGYNGIFCSNDLLAGKLMSFLALRGIRAPEDVGVIGFDGFSFAEFTIAPLTTIIQPLQQMAELAVSTLLEKIARNTIGALPEPILIKPWLHRGSSCGCGCHNSNSIYWEEPPFWLTGNRYCEALPEALRPVETPEVTG